MTDVVEESWKDVAGYEGRYQVSDMGRVRSLDRYSVQKHPLTGKDFKRIYRGRILSPSYTTGYPLVKFSVESSIVYKKVHRLVAFAFIEKVDGKDDVNHIDGNKKNNKASNLEWCNDSENMQHAIALGLVKVGADKPNAIFSNDDVFLIRARRAAGETLSAIAKDFDCGISSVFRVCRSYGKI